MGGFYGHTRVSAAAKAVKDTGRPMTTSEVREALEAGGIPDPKKNKTSVALQRAADAGLIRRDPDAKKFDPMWSVLLET